MYFIVNISKEGFKISTFLPIINFLYLFLISYTIGITIDQI